MKLVLASNNAGKLAELRELLAPLGVTLLPQAELGIGEAEEPHCTFVENALAKARHAAAASGLPAIADDAGLCVEAFGGQPGVDTAHYATRFGYAKGDANNVRALLEQMAHIRGPPRRAGQHAGGAALCRRPGAADRGRPRRRRDHPRHRGRPRLRVRPRHVPAGSSARPSPSCRPRLKNAHSHRGQAARAMLALMRERWLAAA